MSRSVYAFVTADLAVTGIQVGESVNDGVNLMPSVGSTAAPDFGI
jgi:hypothetical protein